MLLRLPWFLALAAVALLGCSATNQPNRPNPPTPQPPAPTPPGPKPEPKPQPTPDDGKALSWAQFEAVQADATEATIRAGYGEPFRVSTVDGLRVLVYRGTSADGARRYFEFAFSTDGRLARKSPV